MMTVYLERRAINKLTSNSIYDTTVALSNKSSSNPNGWEQVEIRVKGAKKNV